MKKVTSRIFIWIIIGISTLGLIDILIFQYNLNEFSYYLSIATSIIGLTGAILYFKQVDFFKYLILFWIIVQFIEFSEYLITPEGIKYWKSVFKAKQFFELQIGQTFDINNAGHRLELNLVPFLYLGFYQTLRLSSYRNKAFKAIRFRENNEFEPSSFIGKIVDQFTLGNEKKSFLVKLNSPIIDKHENVFEHCIISDSKSKQFRPGKNLNLNLYLISRDKLTKNLKIKISELEYIDWIEGRIAN